LDNVSNFYPLSNHSINKSGSVFEQSLHNLLNLVLFSLDFLVVEASYFLTLLRSIYLNILHLPTTSSNFINELFKALTTVSDVRLVVGFPSLTNLNLLLKSNLSNLRTVAYSLTSEAHLHFISYTVNLESFYQSNLKSLEESSSNFRTQRAQNPVFKPDFKSGNFFTREDFSRKPFLLTTISDITKGMRRPA
jgi:hypothetical protein